MATHPPTLLHPVRAAAWMSGGIAALLAVCLPFMPIERPASALAFGLGYAVFLSVFSVGLGLAARNRFLLWWIALGSLPFVGMLAFRLLLQLEPETLMRVLPWWLHAQGVVLAAYLAMGLGVAGWGWAQYALWRHSTGRAEAGER